MSTSKRVVLFIKAALTSGGSVLVHRHMGRSRSATLVAAYLIAEHNLSWQDALRDIQRSRPSAAPNVGFLRQLKSYTPALAVCTDGATCTCHEMAALRGLRLRGMLRRAAIGALAASRANIMLRSIHARAARRAAARGGGIPSRSITSRHVRRPRRGRGCPCH